MRNRLLRSILALPAFGTILGFLACETSTLDLGSSIPDASTDVEITIPEAGVDDGIGLRLDGAACTLTGQRRDLVDAPAYALWLTAVCPEVGPIRVVLASRADIPYPQRCGMNVTMNVMVDDEVDAGIVDAGGTVYNYRADALLGTCTVATGATMTAPETPFQIDATIVNGLGTERHLRYGSGDYLRDGGMNDETRTVSTEPGPGRPMPETCGLDGGACTQDSDCPGRVPCFCSNVGICLTASNCAIDADCPVGRTCSLSFLSTPTARWPLGHFCTTPTDDCTCVVPTGANPGAFKCAFDSEAGHWGCHYGM